MTKRRRSIRLPGWLLLLVTLAVALLLPSAAYADGTDGSGTIAAVPGAVSASSTGNSLTFTYTADSVGTPLGGAIEVDVPDGWTAPSTASGAGQVTASAGTVTVSPGGDGTGGTIDVSGLVLNPAGTVTIIYSDATAPSTPGQDTFTTSEEASAVGTLTQLGSQPAVQVFAPDGSGAVAAAPSSVFAGSTQPFSFTYTAANGGIQDGTLDMTVPSGWTPPQIGGSSAPGYVTSSLTGSDALLDQSGTVSIQPGDVVQVTGVDLAAGDTLLISYDDVTAPAAGTYTFTTDEGSLGGDEPAALATPPQVGVTSVQTPGAPTLGPASPGNGQVQLSWSPPAENGGGSITDYVIDEYAGGDTSTTPTVIDTGSSATAATVPSLTNGQEYTFTVQGVNSAGGGTPSDPESTTPYTVPGAPTLESPTPEDGGMQLAWSAPSDGGSALTGYLINVYSGSGTSGTATVVSVGATATSTTVPNLTNGGDYTFTVVAVNAAGNGPASNSETGIPATAPAAPSLTSLSPGNQSVTVSWSASTDDGGAAVNDYLINVYSGSDTSTFVETIDTETTTTSATVPDLQNGQEYTFTVQAANTAGDGPASASQSATPYGIPGAPTLSTPTPEDGQVQLSWSPPLHDGGGVDDYLIDVYSGADTSGTPKVIDTGSAATTATVPDLTDGHEYTFTIEAANPAGSGAASEPQSTTLPTAPAAPSLTSVSPGNQKVQLTWSAPAGDVTDYLINEYSGSGVSGVATVIDTKSTDLSVPVSGLTNGQQYTFTVQAVNSAGDGPASAPVSATPSTVPGPPSQILLSPGNQRMRVAWSPPSQDGGAPVADYLIDVSGTSGTSVIDTGSSSPSATVSGLTNGQQYTFTVQAANVSGPGSASEPESATPATTAAAPRLLGTSAGDGIVEISWSPTSAVDDGGAAITGYEVFRSTSAGQKGTELATVDSGDSYIDQTVTNNETYYYEVAAVNQAGTGGTSNQLSATPQAFVAPPTLVKTKTIQGHDVTFSAPNQCIKAGKVRGKLTVSSRSAHAKRLVIGRSVFTVGTLAKKTIRRSKPSSSPVPVTMNVKHTAPGGSYPFIAAASIAVGRGAAHTYRLRLTITAC